MGFSSLPKKSLSLQFQLCYSLAKNEWWREVQVHSRTLYRKSRAKGGSKGSYKVKGTQIEVVRRGCYRQSLIPLLVAFLGSKHRTSSLFCGCGGTASWKRPYPAAAQPRWPYRWFLASVCCHPATLPLSQSNPCSRTCWWSCAHSFGNAPGSSGPEPPSPSVPHASLCTRSHHSTSTQPEWCSRHSAGLCCFPSCRGPGRPLDPFWRSHSPYLSTQRTGWAGWALPGELSAVQWRSSEAGTCSPLWHRGNRGSP